MRPHRAVLYARVSTRGGDQDPKVQLHALHPWAEARGWTIVAEHTDRITGDPTRRRGDPPGLRQALDLIERRKADVLAVFAADRLVRSPVHLLQLVARVQSLGGHVASLQDGADLDTTTDAGELLLFIRGWWSRIELKLIRSRINAGLASARARGVKLGRPRRDHPTAEQVRTLRAAGHSWATVAAVLDCSVGLARKRAVE